MSGTYRHRTGAGVAVLVAVMAFMIDAVTVAAHGGHEHQEDGLQFGGIVDVGVTVGVLAMAYILATWILRYRDQSAASGSRPAGREEPRSPE